MTMAVRLGQVALLLVAAVLGMALVMGLGSADTGPLEKIALFLAAALCLWGAVILPRMASRLRARM